MIVYVVIESDRGYGITIIGVYTSQEIAQSICDTSSHYEI